jgi:chromate transporter
MGRMVISSNTPDFREMVRVFARIGFLSFGGPAGQIALMHRELVEERQWVDEDQYLHALNFCHLLPGPEAQQLATWIGWKLHGLRGGLAAGLLFVVPGALIILALSALYAVAADLDWFAALFLGIKAAVLAIVVQALLRIAGRALNTNFKRGLAVSAFFALFAFNAPFPLVVLGAGAIGMMVAAMRPHWLALKSGSGEPLTTPRSLGALDPHNADLGRNLGGAHAAGSCHAGPRACAVGYRRLLLAAGRGHIRRRLRRPCLYGAGIGAELWLAERGRNG